MEKSLAQDKGRLEVEVEVLKTKVSKASNLSIIEFKEFEAYKFSLTSTVVIFLSKEKIKMERLV